LMVGATSSNTALIPDPTVDYTSPNGGGSLAYAPLADQNGSAVITVTVMDSAGTANGGADTTQVAFTVVVNPVNDTPVVDDQSLVTDTETPIVVDLTGTDIEGDNLTYALVGDFSNPALGSLTDFEQGPPGLPVNEARVTFVPVGNGPTGTGSFVYEVCDDGAPPGPACAQATVTIQVVETLNDPPAPRPDAVRVGPGGTATTLFPAGTSLLANDSDPNGDNLVVTTTPVSGPDHGSLALQTDGTFSYTHADDGSTADQFVYEVCDDGTPVRCATTTVFIEIAPETMLVSVEISGSGSVVSSPAGIDCGTTCAATFFTGTDLPIDLFATPDAGYAFSGWDVDLSSADCLDGRLTVAADASCTAVFVVPPPPNGDPIDLSVTIAGTGSGTVTSAPEGISCPPDCSETFSFGTRVSLLPEPELDSTFEGFSGDGDCLDGELDGTGSADCTVTFELLPATRWTLTVLFEGDGAGDVTSAGGEIGCSDDCSALIGDGETVVLNARPADGSSFAGYSGDCDTVSGFPFRATLVMGADASCTATFNGPQ